jgi:hypothetical protein
MGISAALGSGALVPAGLGFRNLLINGDFRINQRQLSSRTTTGYLHDRWRLETSGGTSTYSTQPFTLGNQIAGFESRNFAQVAVAGQSASSNYSIFQQIVEGVRSAAGQTVTVSFYARATSGTPKISVELVQGFGTGGSPSAGVNINAGIVTISTSWQRYSVTIQVPSIAGKTIGNIDDYLAVYLWLSGGSDYAARTNSIGIQNSTFQIWGVQAETNQYATSLEIRPEGVELGLCQRYYWEIRSWGGDDGLCQGHHYGAQAVWCVVQYPVQMRKAPAFALASGVYNAYTSGMGNQVSTAAAYQMTPQIATIYFSTINARSLGVGSWIASSAGILYFVAEYFA